jgi:hypothetical protein
LHQIQAQRMLISHLMLAGATMVKALQISTIGLGIVFASGMAALADSIDGTWCSERDHRQMTIAGPHATLPGGRQIIGEYSRHRFSFTIPMPDADAGKLMSLRLMGELSMVSVVASADGTMPSEPEHWKRCELTS